MSEQSPSCVPPDVFWKIDQELAELLWGRGDGGTVSQRLAEPIAALFNVPVDEAKSVLHAAIAVSAGSAASKAAHPLIGLAVGFALFRLLEIDRCR